MPEDVAPQTVATVDSTPQPSAPTAASAAPVIDPTRQNIIEKYEQRFAPPPAPEPVVQAAEPPPVPAAVQPDPRDTELAALKATVQAMQEKLNPPAPAPVLTSEAAPDWLALLASGKKDDGEAALAKLLQGKIAPEIIEQAVVRAQERITLERNITTFNNEVRQSNPEVIPMESYITYAANARITKALQGGTVKTPADYEKVYKEAVNAEVENARTLIQTFRGAGKTEAMTRTTVLQSQPALAPSPVTSVREQAAPQTEHVDSPSDYLQKRQQLKAAGQGMAFAT